MTTVAELIAFLGQFPPETEVDVLAGRNSRNYEGDSFGRAALELPAQPLDVGQHYFAGGTVEYTGPSTGLLDKTKAYPPTLFLGKED